jgi:hypothetical protein
MKPAVESLGTDAFISSDHFSRRGFGFFFGEINSHQPVIVSAAFEQSFVLSDFA